MMRLMIKEEAAMSFWKMILPVVVIAATAACSVSPVDEIGKNTEEKKNDPNRMISVRFVASNPEADPGTRTTMLVEKSEDGTVYKPMWNPGDAITLVSLAAGENEGYEDEGDGQYRFVATTQEAAETSSFVGQLPATAASYYAVLEQPPFDNIDFELGLRYYGHYDDAWNWIEEELYYVHLPSTQYPQLNSFDSAADIMVSGPIVVPEVDPNATSIEIEAPTFTRVSSFLKVSLKDKTTMSGMSGQHPKVVMINAMGREVGVPLANEDFYGGAGIDLETATIRDFGYGTTGTIVAHYTPDTRFEIDDQGNGAAYFVTYPATMTGTLSVLAITEDYLFSRDLDLSRLENGLVTEAGKVTELIVAMHDEDVHPLPTVNHIELGADELDMEANGRPGELYGGFVLNDAEAENWDGFSEFLIDPHEITVSSSNPDMVEAELGYFDSHNTVWIENTEFMEPFFVIELTPKQKTSTDPVIVTVSYKGHSATYPVTVSQPEPIVFADPLVEEICLAQSIQNYNYEIGEYETIGLDYNHNGVITKREAAAWEELGSNTFENQAITSFDELQYFTGLTGLGYQLFKGCTKLRSIILPSGIRELGPYTFNGCSSLTAIDLPDGLTSLGNYTFQNCSSLTAIDLPDGLTSIGSDTFQNCSSLTAIDLPESLTSIPATTAFSGCSGISSVTGKYTSEDHRCIIEPIEGDYCKIVKFFSNGLTSYTVPEQYDGKYCSAFYAGAFDTLPEGGFTLDLSNTKVSYIPASAFKDVANLTGIVPPVPEQGHTLSLGTSAFEGSGITEIDLSNFYFDSATAAFKNCVHLKRVILQNPISSVPESFFDGSGLEEITFADNVFIDKRAFAGTKLTSVTIPHSGNSSGYISQEAFADCTELVDVFLTSSARTSDNYACPFSGCTKLEHIYVPVGQADAFYNNNSYYSYYIVDVRSKIVEDYVVESASLSITADDISGFSSKTVVHWTLVTTGHVFTTNEPASYTYTGDEEYEVGQNPSQTEPRTCEITYSTHGETATCTITQGVFIPSGVEIDFCDGEWGPWSEDLMNTYGSDLTANYVQNKGNDHFTLYKSNIEGQASTVASMRIKFWGYESFVFYLNSYAERGYDYAWAVQLDEDKLTSYSSSHAILSTSGYNYSPNMLNSFRYINISTPDKGEHFVWVQYRKDSGGDQNIDCASVLLPTDQQ